MVKIISVIALLLASVRANAVDWDDPFHTNPLPPTNAFGTIRINGDPCTEVDSLGTLSIADVVDRTLCHNPKSHEVWANARFQAAQIGVAQAPYLPNATVAGAVGRNWNDNSGINSLAANINLTYLLYDFGGRDAALENARQLFQAATATQDSTVQSLFLSAIQGYYQVNAAQAALESTQQAVISSQASLDAATSRYKVGIATPADRLQAQTAYSQALLNHINAEGVLQNTRGSLANLMGMDANKPYTLQASTEAPVYQKFQADVGELIAEARRRRPDLAAAEAQIKAAEANVGVAQAAGKPNISVTTNLGIQDAQLSGLTNNGGIGLNISIPLFTGFANTYKIRAAQELAEAQKASRDQIHLQIALDVWTAYQNVQTNTQSVQTSQDLVISATQNADVALGRYKAGVGNIIDVITAQSSLASARSQHIQAAFNWDIARAALAYAIGQLDEVQTGLNFLSSESKK